MAKTARKGAPKKVEQTPAPAPVPVEVPHTDPAPVAPVKPEGVIGTIKSMLDTKTGATQAEILEALVQKFPTRTREGMSSTVRIQCSRLAKSTGRAIISKEIVGRGRVYKFEDRGPVPGKEVVKEAPNPEVTQ